MFMNTRLQVLEFHKAMGQPIGDTPKLLEDERMRLRLRLVAEEFFELLEASLSKSPEFDRIAIAKAETMLAIKYTHVDVNMVEVADALGDLDYVIEGMRIEMGIDGAPIAAEIHRSNMSKLGPDGKPIKREDGKVVKPPSWTPPDIAGCLQLQGVQGVPGIHEAIRKVQ
jgi:predicted HAD superfamily Cof-like phosphohydrolase